MGDQVEEIKSKVDIAALIGEKIALKQRGRRFLALCPFHSEKTPSFTVSPELGIFKCFGCGAGGDAFTFLERYEGMNFVEALEYLAERAGVKLERRFVNDQLADQDKKIFEINHLAAEYFHFLLTKHRVGEKGLEYLLNRKVRKDAISHFFIGYSLDRWDGLLTFLTKKGYPPEALESAGLVISKMTNDRAHSTFNIQHSRYYDRFRGRVMFPLRDVRGQVVGFAGRVIPSAVEGPDTTQAKYINSPETAVYHKGKHLFGIFENKDEIRKQDRAVLVEGELDAISSWQAGVKNVAAVKGTALTADQVKLIRRYTRNITMALDADSAGWEALIRSLPILETHGMNVRVVTLSGGFKDPDDFAKVDPAGWRRLIAGTTSVYGAIISGTAERIGIDSGEQKKQVSEIIVPVLAGIANAVEQDHWIKTAAKTLDVREEAVRKQMEEFQRIGRVSKSKEQRIENIKQETVKDGDGRRNRAEILSKYLLAFLIQTKQPVPEKLNLDWIEPVGLKKIISELRSSNSSSGRWSGQEFRSGLAEELRDLFDVAALMPFGENILDGDMNQEAESVLADLEKTWIRTQLRDKTISPQLVSSLTARLRVLSAVG